MVEKRSGSRFGSLGKRCEVFELMCKLVSLRCTHLAAGNPEPHSDWPMASRKSFYVGGGR